MLSFAEQAIWQSRSRGEHSEGELQADLKHWNLVLSNQTGENGAEVNRGSGCLCSYIASLQARGITPSGFLAELFFIWNIQLNTTVVHGGGVPNSLPGSHLHYSMKVPELEDLVSFEKVLPGEQHLLLLCYCPEFLKRMLRCKLL